jgi:hypothetical protein
MFAAEVLKLRRNRGLMAFALLLSVGVVVLFFGYTGGQHATDPRHYGPAGGLFGFGRGVRLVGLYFGALVAALIGTEAATADQTSGVFRDLVATGRSRISLYGVRAPAALCVTLAITGTAFALTTACSFLLAGNQPTPSVGVILQSAAWIALANAMVVFLAVGVGSLTGSRAVTLVGVIGWLTVATQLLLQVNSLGSIRDGVLSAALGQLAPVGGTVLGITMATGTAVAVLAGWLVIPAALGAWRTVTKDA